MTIKKSVTNYICLIGAMLLSGAFAANAMAAETLTASTSLTVVRVTSFLYAPTPRDIMNWGGAWPSSPDSGPVPTGQQVYLHDVHWGTHHQYWDTVPYYTPYPSFSNGLNSMICNVYSTDKGKTFTLASWDYLANYSHEKGAESGMPDCWMGTMVHAYCGFEGGYCNGENRSNLYFTEYPSGSTSNCWGEQILQQ